MIGQKFQELKTERKWVIALLIVFIPGLLSVTGNTLIQQKSQPYTQRYMEEIGTMTDEQLEAMENIQGFIGTITLVFGIIFILVFWILKSAVFHLAARFLGGEHAELFSTVHLIAYTYIPFIGKGIVDLYRGLTYQLPSYEEYWYQLQNPDILANFIREYFNIFVLCALPLMVIAVREQYNLSNKKAVVAVLVPYIGYWVIQLVLASVGARLLGGM